MAASPEFYKPAAFSPSPCASGLQLVPPTPMGATADDYYGSCRTPTGSRISYLKEPTTCPPAPRKQPLCKKRLFVHHQHQQQQQQQGGAAAENTATATVISLRLDELERIFRPHPPKTQEQQQEQGQADKRRRSARNHRHNNTSSSSLD